MYYTKAQYEDGTPLSLIMADKTRVPQVRNVAGQESFIWPVTYKPWTIILPGDSVLDSVGERKTVESINDRDYGWVYPCYEEFRQGSLTLICTEEIPSHRKGIAALQWPLQKTETGAHEIETSPKELNHISDGVTTHGTLCGVDVSPFLEPGKWSYYSPDWPYCPTCLQLDG